MAGKEPTYSSVKIEDGLLTLAGVIVEAMKIEGKKIGGKKPNIARLVSDLLREPLNKRYPAAVKVLEGFEA